MSVSAKTGWLLLVSQRRQERPLGVAVRLVPAKPNEKLPGARAAEDVAGLEDAVTAGDVSGEHVDSIARHAKKLTAEQRAVFDFESLIAEAVGLPPETFDRLVKRRVERVVADHGLADTKAKQAASEFRHWFDHDTGMGGSPARWIQNDMNY